MIYLACEQAGPFMAVVLLNEELRRQLDKVQDKAPMLQEDSHE